MRELAEKNNARFRAVHTFCSNRDVWSERVIARIENSFPTETPAQWDTIMAELEWFHPWEAGEALFIDSMDPIAKIFKE